MLSLLEKKFLEKQSEEGKVTQLQLIVCHGVKVMEAGAEEAWLHPPCQEAKGDEYSGHFLISTQFGTQDLNLENPSQRCTESNHTVIDSNSHYVHGQDQTLQ